MMAGNACIVYEDDDDDDGDDDDIYGNGMWADNI